MKKLFVFLLFLTACTAQVNQVNKLNPAEFKQLIENNNEVFLLDTHIPEQHHIKGTDAFIPYDQIKENVDRFPQDKNTPIAVYCRSGSMSDQASKELVSMGYKNVYDLIGGANAWRSSGYEFEVEQ